MALIDVTYVKKKPDTDKEIKISFYSQSGKHIGKVVVAVTCSYVSQ